MGIKMLFTILFVLVLFLVPQAEAHVGNPCLASEHLDESHEFCFITDEEAVDVPPITEKVKPATDHLDSTRLYDQEGDADHRHKIRAIGVPGENYDKTHLEDDGLGTRIVSIPVFDRDFNSSTGSPSPCYEINSDRLETFYSYTHRRNPHPFADEGITYPPLNPPHNVSVIAVGVEIKWDGGAGPGLDYETASVDGDGNHYYDYTITAWDAVDEGRSCENSVDPAWKLSETFRLYVTDVDETINYPPTFDTQMDQMAVFENADPDVEICCSIVDVSDRDTAPEDLVYSLRGDDADSFRITTGAMYPSGNGQPNGFIFATRTFDYETKNRYEVTARVEDPEGLFLERSFTIHVVDVVNEGCGPPHFPGNGISPFDVRVHLSNTDSNGNIRSYDDGNCTVEPPPVEEEVENTPPPTTGRTSPPLVSNPPSSSNSDGGGGGGSGGNSGGGGGGSSSSSGNGNSSLTNTTPNSDEETQLGPESPVYSLENPGPNSFQSGVGLISGWVCDAEVVEIELNGAPQEAAYGTLRSDTEAVCGDIDNGFGLLFNWNLLGDGEHTIVAFSDGEEFGRTTFTVTTLGQEFVSDVPERTVTIEDWPGSGETVTLEWQQSLQNFVITDME